MNALRLTLVAAGVALFAASDFGTRECQAQTYYSVQVKAYYYIGPFDVQWETIETTTDRQDAYELRDFIEFLLKKDPWKLYDMMQDDYGLSQNAFFDDVRVIQWNIWSGQMEVLPVWSLP